MFLLVRVRTWMMTYTDKKRTGAIRLMKENQIAPQTPGDLKEDL
jgi:hypothetical protein